VIVGSFGEVIMYGIRKIGDSIPTAHGIRRADHAFGPCTTP
jgi:hypothetical protein